VVKQLPPGFPMQLAMDIVDIAFMRLEPGCRELSGQFLLILARVVFDNYELFPAKEAKRAGPEVD
jgi:hypothetical protein